MKSEVLENTSDQKAANDHSFTHNLTGVLSRTSTPVVDLYDNSYEQLTDPKILDMRLSAVYEYTPMAMLAIFMLIVINAFALYLIEPGKDLLSWTIIAIGIILVRFVHYREFRSQRSLRSQQYWMWTHYFYSILSGALWGYAVYALLPDDSLPHQFILIMSVGGLVAGASSSLSLTPYAFFLYMLVSIVPMSLKFYTLDPDYSLLLMPFCYVYMLFMWRTCLKNSQSAVNNLHQSIFLQEQSHHLENSSRRLNLQIDSSPLGVIEWDCRLEISRWNLAARSLFGYEDSSTTCSSISQLLQQNEEFSHLHHLKKSTSGTHENIHCLTRKGKPIICEWTSAPLLDEEGKLLGFTSFIRDISKRIEHEAFIRKKAFYDDLTELPNRHYFLDQLRQTLGKLNREQNFCAVFFMDMDNFKHINDSLGHDFGDELLKQFSERLRKRIRKFETIARFGGDEFVILLENLNLDRKQAQVLSAQVADSIQLLMKTPFHLAGNDYSVTTSIGITLFNDARHGQHELLKQADLALYESKHKGRNTYSFFESAMGNKAARHLQLLKHLRGAISRDEMHIVLQPKVDIASMQMKGAEVLVRWESLELGVVSPAEFIPVLENSAMMSEVGLWVMAEAMQCLNKWFRKGIWPDEGKMSINISPRQLLSQKFVDEVRQLLVVNDIPSQLVEFEITENVLVHNTDTVSSILSELNKLGISFSIDDFGTGYSSLAYLKRLPIDVIKIDKSFIDNFVEKSNDRAIVKSILSICNELKITSVAEGVEHNEQRDLLHSLGCDLLQGYLYSKPLTVEEMSQLLAREKA